MFKRDYKKFVDDEVKNNKSLVYMSINVRYKDGIIIRYLGRCKFEEESV